MPIFPELSTIREAQKLLQKYFGPTPLAKARARYRKGAEVYFKNETVLPTGTFKPRGALYGLIVNLEHRAIAEVTAASTGNHGAAVAFAAKTLGLPVTIFLPKNPNLVKRKKISDLGAQIIEVGGADLTHASEAAKDYSTRQGIYFLNDSTDPNLPAGPGTIGLEILEQLPDVTEVLVPMGDTALIRGVGAAIKQVAPHVKVVGVQAERAPSYCLSWRAGKPVPTETCDTCADGLATRTPEAENVDAIRKVVDEVALVSEDGMIEAVRYLWHDEAILAEPSGAATTAAWMNRAAASGNIVLLVTGANISDETRRQAGV